MKLLNFSLQFGNLNEIGSQDKFNTVTFGVIRTAIPVNASLNIYLASFKKTSTFKKNFRIL